MNILPLLRFKCAKTNVSVVECVWTLVLTVPSAWRNIRKSTRINAVCAELNEPETQTQISGGTSKGIWVLAETEADGTLSAVTKELLGKAAVLAEKLHQDVEALLIGSESDAAVSSLAAYGAQRIHLAGHPSLASFIEENYARAAVQVIRECRPDILLVGATPRGRGLSARIAALLQTGLTADCTELDIDAETGLLQQIRPAFGGNLMATIATPAHRPQMASVRPGVMKAREADPALKGECIRHDLSDFKCDDRIRLLDEALETAGGDSLGNSRIVVGVGRGVKKKETVEHICQWAKRLGAAVAGSRAAVEAGLIDAHLQVGQTGQTIAPDLYIAIGISGQIQHTAGIAGAKRIIAINPDKTVGRSDNAGARAAESKVPFACPARCRRVGLWQRRRARLLSAGRFPGRVQSDLRAVGGKSRYRIGRR